MPLVQDHFLQGMRATLNLSSIRSVPDASSRTEDYIHALQQSFGTGLVLIFDSRLWELEMHDTRGLRDALLTNDFPKDAEYLFSYTVRGTLVRLEDSVILWSDLCYVQLEFKADDGPTPNRLQMEYSLMKPRLDLLV